jgi:hypothetical protein
MFRRFQQFVGWCWCSALLVMSMMVFGGAFVLSQDTARSGNGTTQQLDANAFARKGFVTAIENDESAVEADDEKSGSDESTATEQESSEEQADEKMTAEEATSDEANGQETVETEPAAESAAEEEVTSGETTSDEPADEPKSSNEEPAEENAKEEMEEEEKPVTSEATEETAEGETSPEAPAEEEMASEEKQAEEKPVEEMSEDEKPAEVEPAEEMKNEEKAAEEVEAEEKMAAERAADLRTEIEQIVTEKLTAELAAAEEKAAAEKVEAETATAEKANAERAAAEKALLAKVQLLLENEFNKTKEFVKQSIEQQTKIDEKAATGSGDLKTLRAEIDAMKKDFDARLSKLEQAQSQILSALGTKSTTDVSGQTLPNATTADRTVSASQISDRLQRAKMLMLHRDNQAALAEIDGIVQLDRNNPLAHYLRAYLVLQSGQSTEALKAVTLAVACERQRPVKNWYQQMEWLQGPSRVWLEENRQNLSGR